MTRQELRTWDRLPFSAKPVHPVPQRRVLISRRATHAPRLLMVALVAVDVVAVAHLLALLVAL